MLLTIVVSILQHSYAHAQVEAPALKVGSNCQDQCSFSLVESIPEGDMYSNVGNLHTKDVWLDLINRAQSSIEISSFHWTLRFNEGYEYHSSVEGEKVFQALLAAGSKNNVHTRIVQNVPIRKLTNTDTDFLVKHHAAETRTLNFTKLLGRGVLHTKFSLIDRKHFYMGSANMDWRAITQIKELGIVVYNCSCLAKDLAKIFEMYWKLGAPDATIPDSWPAEFTTTANMINPLNIADRGHNYSVYITSSPPALCPEGRTAEDDAIVTVMEEAEKFIYISVTVYIPLLQYAPVPRFWPKIDDTIRRVAIDNRVKVKMLIALWHGSKPIQNYFLRSLAALTDSLPGVDIQVVLKRFTLPMTAEQSKIPFARLSHNKYMVTDKTLYIGTSNWSGDFFVETAGAALVCSDLNLPRTANTTIRADLQRVFERDWHSPYAVPLASS